MKQITTCSILPILHSSAPFHPLSKWNDSLQLRQRSVRPTEWVQLVDCIWWLCNTSLYFILIFSCRIGHAPLGLLLLLLLLLLLKYVQHQLHVCHFNRFNAYFLFFLFSVFVWHEHDGSQSNSDFKLYSMNMTQQSATIYTIYII